MEEVVQVDFKSPRAGSKYSNQINEGCAQALMGMVYRNPYEDEIERKAFDYGFESGKTHFSRISA